MTITTLKRYFHPFLQRSKITVAVKAMLQHAFIKLRLLVLVFRRNYIGLSNFFILFQKHLALNTTCWKIVLKCIRSEIINVIHRYIGYVLKDFNKSFVNEPSQSCLKSDEIMLERKNPCQLLGKEVRFQLSYSLNLLHSYQ